ncbi:MAG: small basic protein [Planctomycetota bacterium]
MSIHRSLVLREKLRRHRNVLSRSERLQRLIEDGKFEDKSSVFGLPKLRNILTRAKKVKKETAETPAAGAVTDTAATPGATQVSGAKTATAGAKSASEAKPSATKDKAVASKTKADKK